MKKLWLFISVSFRIWHSAKASRMAAAMTYFTMLSLAPLLTMAIAIAGYFFENNVARNEIIRTVSTFTTTSMAETIASLIENASRPESGLWAGAISVAVLIFAASGAFTQLHDTFDDIWHIPIGKRSGLLFSIRQRFIGIAMVLVAGLLLLSLLVQSAVVATIDGWLAESYPGAVPWLQVIDRGMSYLLMPFVFAMLFWLVPSAKVKLKDVWLAGMTTAVLAAASRYLVQMYLRFSSANEVYGAAGSLVVLLVWVYMTALVVFFGAAMSHAYALTYGSRSGDEIPEGEPMTTKLVEKRQKLMAGEKVDRDRQRLRDVLIGSDSRE